MWPRINRVVQSYHYSTIIVFIIRFIIFLMVINNGVINDCSLSVNRSCATHAMPLLIGLILHLLHPRS